MEIVVGITVSKKSIRSQQVGYHQFIGILYLLTIYYDTYYVIYMENNVINVINPYNKILSSNVKKTHCHH